MKLLIVINSLILAGAEMLVSEIAPLLQQRGITVSVLVLKRLEGPLENILGQSTVPVIFSGSNRIYSPSQIWEMRSRFSVVAVAQTHKFPAQLWTAAARFGSRQPLLITTEHNTENNRRKPWLRPLDTFIYSRFDHIVCNSEATRSRLQEWVPAVKTGMSVIPNGISLQRLAEASPLNRQELIGRDDVPLLISVARLQPQKDHVTLLRAVAMTGTAHLILVGEGELRPGLEKLAAEMGIRERVHFLGRRADVPALLKTCDAFVHSTHSDGFCIAALEAMAAGLPVVATRVPGLAEVVGDAGVLVPEQDPGALSGAISAVLGSSERRRELSLAGSERARRFTIEATASAYAELYGRLLARSAHA